MKLKPESEIYRINIDKFHKHLDTCKQCSEQPFNLCLRGRLLMVELQDCDSVTESNFE